MKRQHKHQPRRSGFTLIEVLLVLAILGVIAAMVVPQLMGRSQEAMRKRALNDMAAIETALKMFAVDHNDNFPETLDELVRPQPLPDGRTPKPYVEKIIDPWGSPYFYVRPSDQNSHLNSSNSMGLIPELHSFGPDRNNDGGENDDVNNWERRIRESQGTP